VQQLSSLSRYHFTVAAESPAAIDIMSDAVTITRLSVEHYQSPLGIGEPSPRLSWRMAGAVRDWEQQSYDVRIIGSTSDEEFNVTTSDSVLVPWPAAPLVSRQTAGVSVRSHGRDGSVTPWSSLRIEAGLLRRSDWKAQLITCDQQDEDKPKRPFRVITTFVPPKHLGQARLYITAHGVYEAYINGQRVGDEVLAPGWTDYRFNLNYRVHDVTDLLVPGQENTLGAWVGEGWYAGRLGFGQGARNIYGTRTALLAQLEVDGEVRVLTDESWKWSYGSTYSSEIYDGEGYSSREDDRWALTEDWRGVETVGFPLTLPSASQAPPVREIERFSAVEMIQTPFGKTIIDFGQNFAGYVQLLGEPPATTGELVLTHAEVLEHGELGIRPLRTAKCQDTILLGGQVRGWKPRFTFHGFR
jgi:alpha-L-rhamnosidase